ncbi:tyrosine--tRNA ligase [Lachnospiraceae bacterium MD1]|jgi:tyrosyl-tRNA synthetase|uniref:Tyrosine--tRNA ligase n=1 Tax=Variimorphobacter saccharofermentans TaxID=2755051 RepID=A0A839K4Y2_9FIRM|nr:tyrosine--tRNA ligase [Variimorphobacter saccharofermentans]MBB2183731.1 tyrosine--tRNA ligase [Variimorphobacter saccharofermentans]
MKRISIEEQIKIISKGAAELISVEELREKLSEVENEGRPLIIKLGLDPTAPDIHLGHTVVLRKIRQMQEMGHHAVIIIGDFTAKIGDPTGKSKTRKPLSEEQVRKNAMTYTNQIFKVIDKSKTTVRFNSEWLSKLQFEEVLRLAASTTVARLLERDDFQSRFRRSEPIGLHEFFYPLMQAYDSVEINADLELGGTDQTFNILMGRTLQSSMGKKRQIAMFMPILEGLDGVEKMSKSLGNYIGIFEPAEVMFKKVMEIPDHLILRYYELVTDEHPDRIAEIRMELENGKNPRDCKLELAKIITGLYHSAEEVQKAEEYFHMVFQKGELPQEMPLIDAGDRGRTLMELIPLLVEHGIVPSGSEFRRLVQQGGVQSNQMKVTDLNMELMEKEIVLKVGKKKFVRVIRNI